LKRVIVLLLSLGFSFEASAYFQMDLLKGKKRAGDSSVQWTLADWLTQKNKQRLADQWLALHSSTDLFDLNLSGSSQSYKLKSDVGGVSATHNQNSQVYRLDGYISIFNINGEFEKTNEGRESYGGAAGLRLLGSNSQTTNFVARYGWRRLNDFPAGERWDNQYAEAELHIYVVKMLGLNGAYRYYFPSNSNLGNRLAGHRTNAGAFIELGIFRVYGNYFWEPLQLRAADGTVTQENRDGFEGGLMLLL
jgi:hypothetical protein